MLPWGLKNRPYQDHLVESFANLHRIRLLETSLAAPFGACVPHLDTVIACARSPLEGGVSASKFSSERPIITFPHSRALSLAFRMATNQTSQPHFSGDQINQICVFDVLGCTVLPSHPYLDFSPTSLWTFRLFTRIVPSCLFARHAMPTQSRSDNTE
jgi:hypothetical protein